MGRSDGGEGQEYFLILIPPVHAPIRFCRGGCRPPRSLHCHPRGPPACL